MRLQLRGYSLLVHLSWPEDRKPRPVPYSEYRDSGNEIDSTLLGSPPASHV